MRNSRRRERQRGRGVAEGWADELMVDTLTSDVRKADRGTCDTSVGLP